MKVSKKVKELPWPEQYSNDNSNIHFRMHFRWPVAEGERLCCIDFLRNQTHKGWFTPGKDFRLVLSKKNNTVRVLDRGSSRAIRHYLNQLLYRFGTGARTCYPEIDPKDEAALQKWLGVRGESPNHLMPELERWVAAAIDREVLAERDARGELRDEDVALCPEELPAGIAEYIRREVLPMDRVLLYKKGNVRGLCYACGEQVRANAYQRFRQGESVKCPNCGNVVTAYLETSDRFKVDYVDNIASLQLGMDGKTVFFRQWHLLRDSTAKWDNIEGRLKEIARYAVRGDKVAKWQMEYKHASFMNSWREEAASWGRVANVSQTYDGSYEFYLPADWRETVSGTSLKYIELQEYYDSPREHYANRNIIRFAMDWARYPAVEKLWKAGYTQLVHRKIFGMGREYLTTVRWRCDTVEAAMQVSLRWLRQRKAGEWDVFNLQRTQKVLDELGAGHIREADVPLMLKCDISYETLKPALGHASLRKILKYLDKAITAEKARIAEEKAHAKAANRYYYARPAVEEVSTTYRDYLNDCIKLKLDLDDQSVLFPHDLKAAHQRTIEQVQYEQNKEKWEAFEKASKKLNKLCLEQEGLLIRPAATARELIAEGKYLHHCVGGYVDRMAKGVLAIMLIRRADDPQTPYYTLEWRDKRVVQCKTMYNEDYTKNPQVKAFVDAWTQWVLGGCKKKRSVKVA